MVLETAAPPDEPKLMFWHLPLLVLIASVIIVVVVVVDIIVVISGINVLSFSSILSLYIYGLISPWGIPKIHD